VLGTIKSEKIRCKVEQERLKVAIWIEIHKLEEDHFQTTPQNESLIKIQQFRKNPARYMN
jgi:hypothetical protein